MPEYCWETRVSGAILKTWACDCKPVLELLQGEASSRSGFFLKEELP
jgi:hypothetical protein